MICIAELSRNANMVMIRLLGILVRIGGMLMGVVSSCLRSFQKKPPLPLLLLSCLLPSFLPSFLSPSLLPFLTRVLSSPLFQEESFLIGRVFDWKKSFID